MSDCKDPRDPFIGSGRIRQGGILATPKQDFNSHLGGDSSLRHCASHINMSPPLPSPFTASDVQATLELLAANSSSPDGYRFYVVVSDGINSSGDFNGVSAIDDALDYIQVSGHTSEVIVIVNPGTYIVTNPQITSSKVRLWGMYTGDSQNLPTIKIQTPTSDPYGRPVFLIGSAENIKFLAAPGENFSCVNINTTSSGTNTQFDFFIKNCIFENVGLLFTGQRSTQSNLINLSIEKTKFIQTIELWSSSGYHFSLLSNSVPDMITIRDCQFLGFGGSVGVGSHVSLPATTSARNQYVTIDNCYFNYTMLENIATPKLDSSFVSGKNSYIWIDSYGSTFKILNSKVKGIVENIVNSGDVVLFANKGNSNKLIDSKCRFLFIDKSEIYGPADFDADGVEWRLQPTVYSETTSGTVITNSVIRGGFPIFLSGSDLFSDGNTTGIHKNMYGCIISNNEISSVEYNNYSLSNTLICIDTPTTTGVGNLKISISNNSIKNTKTNIPYFPKITNRVSSYNYVSLVRIACEYSSISIESNRFEAFGSSAIFSSLVYTIIGSCLIDARTSSPGSISILNNDISYINNHNSSTDPNYRMNVINTHNSQTVISGNQISYTANSILASGRRYFLEVDADIGNVVISGNNFKRAGALGSEDFSINAFIYFQGAANKCMIIGNLFSSSTPNHPGLAYTNFEDKYRIFWINSSYINNIVCERNTNQRVQRIFKQEERPGDFAYFAYGTSYPTPAISIGGNYAPNTATESPWGRCFVTCEEVDYEEGFGNYSVKMKFDDAGNPNASTSFRFKFLMDSILPQNVYLNRMKFTYKKVDNLLSGGSLKSNIVSAGNGYSADPNTYLWSYDQSLSVLAAGTIVNVDSGELSLNGFSTRNRVSANIDIWGLTQTTSGNQPEIYLSAITFEYTY